MTDDLETVARRVVELGSKATAAPWRRVGKTGYINGRDDTASRLDAEVRVADVGAYRDKELLRFSRDRWDVDLDFIAFTRNHAPALAAEYLRLREDIAAAETSAIMWKARCEQAEAQLAEARRALGFFASVIMSGETWTEVCEQRYRAALAPAEKPGSDDGLDTDYDPSRDM